MAEKGWIEIGRVVGEIGPKGDTGDIGIGTIIKGHYNNYSEFITVHPSGRIGDAYIVDDSYYYWNENSWANAGSVRGEKGDTGANVTIKGSYDSYDDLIREHPTGSDWGITRERENENWDSELRLMDEIKNNFEMAIKMIETGEAEQILIDEENK